MVVNDKYVLAYALKNAVEHKGKAVVGSVIAGLFNHGLKKQDIKKEISKIQKVLGQVNSMSLEEQKSEFKDYEKLIGHRHERQGLPELPDAKRGKVITRMAPSPSGPLHIGHILTIAPNFLYSEKYGGKFYLRIEDTNPENIYKPAYKMIEKESKWLTKGKAIIVLQSKRMNMYYKYAEKLINKNAAYVCDCDKEEFKKLILKKQACKCRRLPKAEQMKRWKKMLSKNDNENYKLGEAVLRFKSNLNHKNPAMRDFSLARINLTPHPLQKLKYRVWPLMNLAVSVDDIELKITHVIRGKEHKDNMIKQRMVYKALGKKGPWAGYIGRIHFKDIEVSCSKMKKGMEEGRYSGWDDPQLPTVISLKKQGYKPEAFLKFAEQRGISEVDKIISREDFFEILDNFNKSA